MKENFGMCGIFGAYTISNEKEKGDNFLFLDRYAEICKKNLWRRGPDFQNHLIIDNKLLLGHTRLSIIDDDEKSNQPFSNENYFLSFNGEIYNFNELKNLIKSKENYTFYTVSDTEVLFKGLQLLGDDFFKYTNGMYAVAFYNKFTEELILHRDPGGMKPLFYTVNEKGFFFSSDIKSLLNIQANKIEIDYSALAEFSKFSSIYGQKTFYSNIKQLLPGEIITIGKNLEFKNRIIKISDFLPTIDNKDKSILNLVKDSVERHLIGNKKICLLLSSGIDSTTLALLLAQTKIRGKIDTFTSNFLGDSSNNEGDMAEEIASTLNLNHTKINIKYKGFLDTIDRVLLSHSQPFSDTAAITLEHIYSQINQDYKVIIQGDGGDELFGGYSRYRIEKFFEMVEYNR